MLCITHTIWTQEFFMVNIHKYLSLITFNCYFSLIFIQTFGSQNSLAIAHFPDIFRSSKKITSASIIATKLLSAESLGFGISTAIKRIAGRFFLLRRQEKSIMAACLGLAIVYVHLHDRDLHTARRHERTFAYTLSLPRDHAVLKTPLFTGEARSRGWLGSLFQSVCRVLRF